MPYFFSVHGGLLRKADVVSHEVYNALLTPGKMRMSPMVSTHANNQPKLYLFVSSSYCVIPADDSKKCTGNLINFCDDGFPVLLPFLKL